MSRPSSPDVVVVGAGFAGLYQLHRLRGLGLSARVFEAGSGIGGTWYWNRYPGARCDVESLEYSYSFSPELEQEWEWTERYPAQPEILRYAEHVAERFDLRRDIELDTRVTAAVWDEESARWAVTTEHGETVTARFCIFATGCLSKPKDLEIPGLDSFAGPVYSTARWPHAGVDFTGRRVAVIGTGSSGIQSIPVIASQAAEMTVYQRTANYSMPAHNGPLTAQAQRERKANYAAFRDAARHSPAGLVGKLPTENALDVTEQERRRAFYKAWSAGNLGAMRRSYADIGVDIRANDMAADFIRDRIRDKVTDPATAEALLPSDHPFGTKRPCLDTGYYETFNSPHVHLVDLKKTPIEAITATGVATADGEVEVDDIVLATGFDAMTGALLSIDIRGRDGRTLADAWADGPVTYLGLGVAGFPNLFTITGPGSPSVLSNMLVSIEQHVDWISDCLARLERDGVTTIEPNADAQAGWVEHVAEVGQATLYPLAKSWYLGANVPGKPRVFMPYIGGVGAYREICDDVAAEDYRGFDLEKASASMS
ncbi:flavin-containing monooxygenase [Pseudonocardia sediminis]|uniref:flavin-containing monooxygenase n=1 Tax=Pseudonocardia sediminis TaxID=1397368 RepID=UPI001F5FEFFA|nr:NAD(P)/FAD-dependent oxidoreductase [Pseudonocardia sediminis]